jgi:signal transduction histidine kinase
MVEEICALLEQRCLDQGIRLTVECKDLQPVFADPKSIEEIFNNLISNAINYSPDGGEVRVSARRAGGQIHIQISDDGIGIPPEELPKIFDKFYRVKHPKTRTVTGTGLGLPIVKRVVEAHHGTIDVESVPDKGTTFTVWLPALSRGDQVPDVRRQDAGG